MNQQDFTAVPDLDLPEGTPVTGYKLVYHASNGDYYPYMNRDPFAIERYIQQIKGPPLKRDVFNVGAPNIKTPDDFDPDRPMPLGYYYWQDKALAEEYADWAAPQPQAHSRIDTSTVWVKWNILDEEEEKHYKGYDWNNPPRLPWVHPKYSVTDGPLKGQSILVGRYELLRVEGTHVVKTENSMDRENEGHVMNEMMIYPEPIATYSITGAKLPDIQSFEEFINQQKPYLIDRKVENRDDSSRWY